MVSMIIFCPVSDNGVAKFKVGTVPEPEPEHYKFKDIGSFNGVDWVPRKKGYSLKSGFDLLYSVTYQRGYVRSASMV